MRGFEFMFLWPRVYLRTMVDNFAQHRPVWASKVHNCLTSYVKRHSVTLGRHQVCLLWHNCVLIHAGLGITSLA